MCHLGSDRLDRHEQHDDPDDGQDFLRIASCVRKTGIVLYSVAADSAPDAGASGNPVRTGSGRYFYISSVPVLIPEGDGGTEERRGGACFRLKHEERIPT